MSFSYLLSISSYSFPTSFSSACGPACENLSVSFSTLLTISASLFTMIVLSYVVTTIDLQIGLIAVFIAVSAVGITQVHIYKFGCLFLPLLLFVMVYHTVAIFFLYIILWTMPQGSSSIAFSFCSQAFNFYLFDLLFVLPPNIL